MAKKATKKEAPEPEKRKSDTDTRRPFLKPADINRDGNTRLQVLPRIAVYVGDYGTQLWIAIRRQDKKEFTLSINTNNRDRIAIGNVLGRNLVDWPGKVFEVYQGKSANDPDKRYVNVFDPTFTQNIDRDERAKADADDIPF